MGGPVTITEQFNFFHGKNGAALEGGSVYVGSAGTNPEVEGNQVAVFSDSALQIPVAQPVGTIAGRAVDGNGTPINIQTAANDYSVTVRSSSNELVFTSRYASQYVSAINVTSVDSVASMKLSNLLSGATAETTAYYGGWAASIIAPKGGAKYNIITLTEYTAITGNLSADGFGDHLMDNGNIAMIYIADNANVYQFGARGDRVTDDTGPIQGTIDYVFNISVFQRPNVYLPAGDYLITELLWKTEVSIIGEDWRHTRLRGIGGSGTKMIKAAAGASMGGAVQRIENMSIIPDSSVVQLTNGIDLSDATNLNGCYFDKLWFNNCDESLAIGKVTADGTTTATTANKLTDSGGGLSAASVGDKVNNLTDGTATTVSAVDSDTALSLNDDIFTNNEDYRVGRGFGDIWMGTIISENSKNGLVIENGDDLHVKSLTSFTNGEYGLKFNAVRDSQVMSMKITETGGVTSSNAGFRIANCWNVQFPASIIRQKVTSDKPSSRLAEISACDEISFDNFNWEGADGASGDTELGLRIIGACDDLKFSNGTIRNVITADTGIGVTVGDGTNAVTRVKMTNVHTYNTGGAGFKQANNADLEMVNCTSDEPMTGSVAATRPGWDLRSDGRTKVLGGRVTATNVTTGHGVHCSSDSNKTLIGITAGDGITATGAVRVFVSECDTVGGGNLAQTVTAIIAPGTINAGAQYSTTVTLTGAKTQDGVLWGPGTGTLGQLNVSVRVGANDTIDLEINNPTGGNIAVASATWTFKLVKLS